MPILRKSIALLPFENLSEDKANAYFADGIQEEILTRLSRIGDLKVISRTSTQRFKNSLESIPDIAKQLGVATILEGSVRKAADQVRVHVQLIDAENDSHLWAERYDRKLIDIFAVESDIAAKIADALQARLTGAERRAISSQPTTNTEAYQLYLKARHQWRNFFAPGYEQVQKILSAQSSSIPALRPLTVVSVAITPLARPTRFYRLHTGHLPRRPFRKSSNWMTRWPTRIISSPLSSYIIRGIGRPPSAPSFAG